ncbi:hypothetical protein [Algoriphagus sp. NG3]|uniref:hypothetical protein n=1 Tax=unclassified Algoriphagus TaxID=2641541 RepID=UPI002A83C3D8|nr:hypothetical protein [Algoriphagus sp. NG3]WPR76842.1 hypothetical protein SLW71_05750 [Algoriphagus sp. NG3]
MRKRSILHVPLLSPVWKKVAYLFFILPIVLIIAIVYYKPDLEFKDPSQIHLGFWAIGFGILNLTKETDEDEMIKSFRLQAFQTGFFWMIWGLSALMIVSYIGSGGFSTNLLSVFSVLFLLNAYIYAAFQYQKYMAKKD